VFEGDTANPPAQNGPLLRSRLLYLSRVYPRATAGTLDRFSYDPSTQSFTMTAASRTPIAPGSRDHETEVYIPPLVRGSVSVSGAAVLDVVQSQPDGSRIAYVAPTGAGAYRVDMH
jgi:hypothetical protein